MKRNILLTTIVLLFISGFTFGQPLSTGDKQVNLGLGLSGWGVPFYVGLDYGIYQDITVGGELSYRAYNEKWGSIDYHHSIIGLSANGNYHFNSIISIPDKWDLYAGLNLGFYVWSSPDSYGGSHSSGLGLGAQVGTRYKLSEKVSLNLEFGGGNAFAGGKLGVSLKI